MTDQEIINALSTETPDAEAALRRWHIARGAMPASSDDCQRALRIAGNQLAAALSNAAAEIARERARADAAEAENARLTAECFSLAATSCGGFYGGDHGHPQCTLVDAQRARAEAAEALLREAATFLPELADTVECLCDFADGQCEWDGPSETMRRYAISARALADKIRGHE